MHVSHLYAYSLLHNSLWFGFCLVNVAHFSLSVSIYLSFSHSPLFRARKFLLPPPANKFYVLCTCYVNVRLLISLRRHIVVVVFFLSFTCVFVLLLRCAYMHVLFALACRCFRERKKEAKRAKEEKKSSFALVSQFFHIYTMTKDKVIRLVVFAWYTPLQLHRYNYYVHII